MKGVSGNEKHRRFVGEHLFLETLLSLTGDYWDGGPEESDPGKDRTQDRCNTGHKKRKPVSSDGEGEAAQCEGDHVSQGRARNVEPCRHPPSMDRVLIGENHQTRRVAAADEKGDQGIKNEG
jgi:hypothetical protein